MTPQEALDLLSNATEPQMAGKISREGFAKLQEALTIMAGLPAQLERTQAEVERLLDLTKNLQRVVAQETEAKEALLLQARLPVPQPPNPVA